MKRVLAPAIVLLVAIVGAHPFCNLAFHCGCSLVGLTAHCNIHHPSPPHCPWCAHPGYFVFAFIFAFSISGFALFLTRRRAFLPHLFFGLFGLFCGALAGAAITGAR